MLLDPESEAESEGESEGEELELWSVAGGSVSPSPPQALSEAVRTRTRGARRVTTRPDTRISFCSCTGRQQPRHPPGHYLCQNPMRDKIVDERASDE